MNPVHLRYGIRSAWRIFPLGIVVGLVALSPLLFYLIRTPGELAERTGSMVYLVGAFSVVLGFLAVLLVFLWICEWATEESQSDEP